MAKGEDFRDQFQSRRKKGARKGKEKRKESHKRDKNEKDFFDNAKVPFHRTHGILAIHGDMSNMLDYATAIKHLLQLIVQYGEIFTGSKIRLKPNETTVYGIDYTRKEYTKRFKHERDGDYEWVENETE